MGYRAIATEIVADAPMAVTDTAALITEDAGNRLLLRAAGGNTDPIYIGTTDQKCTEDHCIAELDADDEVIFNIDTIGCPLYAGCGTGDSGSLIVTVLKLR